MPFDTLQTITAPAKDVLASISYRRALTKHSRSKNPKLVIGIPKSACDGFKPKPTQLFGLMIGTGSDKGRARVVEAWAGMGGVAVRMLKGGAVFRFGYVPMLGQDAAEKEFVDVKAIAGEGTTTGFEISLPAWFKADAK